MRRHDAIVFCLIATLVAVILVDWPGRSTAVSQEGSGEVSTNEQVVMTPLPSALHPRDGEFLRGVALPLYFKELERDYSAQMLELVELGADTVSLVVTWSQNSITSNEILPDDQESRPDEVVRQAIDDAHQAGIRVFLFPILKIRTRQTGQWRGTLRPADVDAWFDSYGEYILHYAEIAESTGVEYFSVGSELGSMESHESHWRTLIEDVREIYSNQLLYSANWDHFEHTPFWDAVDLFGLTAYYELTDSFEAPVSFDLLVEAWDPLRDYIVAFSRAIDRQVVFTEVGYYSQPGTAYHPWDYTRVGEVDLQQQLRCYEAFYQVWRDQPELTGVFFWHWFGEGGEEDISYNPRGKPAADIIRHWYAQWPSLETESE